MAARPDRMTALSMWPAAAAPARPPIERPGGHNLYFRFATELQPGLRGSVGAGYAFMGAKRSTRLVLAADLLVAYGSSGAGGGVHGAATVHWAELAGFSFLNELGVTLETYPRLARFDVYASPLSYEIVSDRMSVHAGILGGLSAATSPDVGRWFMGLSVAATLHLERRQLPSLVGLNRVR
jgi:hypothetical protein